MTRRLGTAVAIGLALASALVAMPARAALVTDVADAADKDDPLDVNFDFKWSRNQKQGKILREFFTPEKGTFDATEGHYHRVTHVLDTNVTIGLYHDLELHGRIPYAISDEQTWGFARVDGVWTNEASSIQNNRLNADGVCQKVGEQLPCATSRPIMPMPGTVYRGGFMDPTVGISWGIFNDEREEKLSEKLFPHKVRTATWVLGFDYTMPIIAVQNPFKINKDVPTVTTTSPDPNAPGPLGTGAHRFDFSMAMSKRVGIVEPFMRLHYTLPVTSAQAFDNCTRASAEDPNNFLMSEWGKKSCTNGDGYWNGKTGLQMPHVGGLLLGAEFIPVEDDTGLRFAMGIQLKADYVSKGRWNSELSDALGRLTWTDQYISLDSRLTADLRVSKFVHFVGFLQLGNDTPHAITSETVGKDRFGENGSAQPDGQVSLNSFERNPNYDARVDQPGRRIKMTGIATFSTSFMLSINF